MWRNGDKGNAYRVLVGQSEGNRLLPRPRRTWEGNTKIDLKEIGLGGMDWIYLAQDRQEGWAFVR
jgi:hypothetical protein